MGKAYQEFVPWGVSGEYPGERGRQWTRAPEARAKPRASVNPASPGEPREAGRKQVVRSARVMFGVSWSHSDLSEGAIP